MKTESKTIKTEDRRCTQIQCGYYLQGGCKDCEECKAKPYIINPKCRRCIRCEGVAGELRWGDKDANKDLLVPKGIIVVVGEKEEKQEIETPILEEMK